MKKAKVGSSAANNDSEYEIIDCGEDFENSEHLYFAFRRGSERVLAEKLFTKRELEEILHRHVDTQ